MALFGSSQSASFQCNYSTGSWGPLKAIYYCSVQNVVSISSVDAAQIDDISGTHKAGYNNDNVEYINVYDKGQIHHFPKGINKFFKNLKGICIGRNGLKEVHHSYYNQLEILEENLFEFNPNLEEIHLNSNKISHINPNVLDKLTKLKTLHLDSNTCINMIASNNPTEFQKIIKAAKDQCINSDYLNLAQKVKNIKIESKNLNSENFKEKLENLENEIKNSKFPNFFQEILQDLKSAQIKKAQDELTTITTPKTITMTTKAITITTEAPKEPEISKFETCSALESKLTKIENKLEENEQKANQTDQKITELDEKVSKLSKDMSTILKDIESANNQNFAAIMKFIENLDKKIEEKLSEIDDAQKKLMNKIHKFNPKATIIR